MIGVEWLVWDRWNLRHIWDRHGVRPETVEAICFGNPVALTSHKHRVVLIGPEPGGQMMTVVIGPVPDQPGAYYTFSARPASRKVRRWYYETKGQVDS